MTVTDINLFKPLKVGDIEVKTRVAMAPLTRFRAPNHLVTDLQPTYYSQRGLSPGTLLISEATFISEAASGYDSAPGIYNEEQVKAWSKVTDAIHAKESFLFIQLWALGRSAIKADLDKRGLPYVSASDIADSSMNPNAPKPTPLTKEDIKQYIKDYVQAAKNAIAAGADGYGGSIENRARFSLEIVDAVSEAIGANKVAIRLSPWGRFGSVDPDVSPIPQFSYVITELEKRALEGKQLAYISLVDPHITMDIQMNEIETQDSNDFARQIWTGVIVKASGFNYESAKDDTEKDDKVIIAFGRHFIANPDLIERFKQNVPLNKYDRTTFYTPGPKGYTDYPFANEVKTEV
ncbi:similar to Saccharomyces cerevisiae YPL171C OYE3 Conserved NADPH oxidoreductase containing flavin mononucleotide (FMN) [Geotrichum candidum]|uniref:Similar to Saccharomyces cerevisiae YPL171C OYE3 Conserved NADPH oxidoreductase containing flavin mononucleotide (FMN) n=1 Tax=Geotrichum candidum TaxID=1173061 RepID=A0A0J9XEV3_GEOCN|nr:similar to Saccharomyces cerevisiae YPL171C OYE3 Conserved NADPH oxidoreductase containing flavin mononucleotide (FMN) [Geotrichum candidum]